LAPLTATGIEQAKETGRKLRGCEARCIIASPMTRALQTACLIAAETGLPLASVEFDLREWLPDSTLSWRTFDEVKAAGADYDRCAGEWPAGEIRTWEPRSSVLRRALGVLQRQAEADDQPFVAVCHSMVMEALTGDRGIEFCGVRRIDDLERLVQLHSADLRQ
ncbi:MAG: histidine phosphatase family protein, partial [Mycobacterium sp.]|nr:histidine phosphatase family protein [Mycobacterium sp.]